MIFIFDWDGTLGGHESVLSETNEKLVKDLHKEGHKVIMATGRGVWDLANRLKKVHSYISPYIIGGNGSSILDLRTKEIIYKKVLPADVYEDVIKYATEREAIIGFISSKPNTDFFKTVPGVNHFLPTGYTKEIPLLDEKSKKYYSTNSFILGMVFKKNDPQHFKDAQAMFTEASVAYADKVFVQVAANNINKWATVKKVIEMEDLIGEKTFAFGDSYNDISMLQGAEVGVVMGDADDEVKATGNIVIESAANNGIDKYIRKNILGE